MSKSDSEEVKSQLFEDVEGLLKEYFQNNLHGQESNQTFFKASLQFLYRQLEKRLENVGSATSSSKTQSNIFSFRKQGDPSKCLPSLGYQEKVRYWASKYIHSGRTNLSRSSSSVAAPRENFHPKCQNTFHRNISNIDNQSGESSEECRLYLQKSDNIGGCITPASLTSSEDRVFIIVSSEIDERKRHCESYVSLGNPDASTSSVNDYQEKLLKDGYVDPLMDNNAWKGQNNTEKQKNVLPDNYFLVTQSLEVTAQDSIKLDVNGVSNSERFKCDASTASGFESTRISKNPSPTEAIYLDGIKNEGVFLRVSLSNPILSHAIAKPRAQEIRSTKEVKKSRTRSSRLHAAILNLFGAKSSEKKSGNKSESKSSKSSTGGNAKLCRDEDALQNIKRMLSNKLSMQSTGQAVTSDQQQNSHEYPKATFSGTYNEVGRLVKPDTSSCSDQKSKLEKLKTLKVCQIPFIPLCQSCDQIYDYSSPGKTTRDAATCTEELITGYPKCKRCFHDFERTLPHLSESSFRKMHYKFGQRDEIEELSSLFLCTFLNDLRKHSQNASFKMNSKNKRTTSRFPDVKSYGTTSWPLSIGHSRKYQGKTQKSYEKYMVNSEHREKPKVLRQPSKFSAWNGDEKSSDSDDEVYRLKRHRRLPKHIADLEKLMSRKRIRSEVKSSLVIRSSHGSEHIPNSK